MLETFGHCRFLAELPYPLLQLEVCRVIRKVTFGQRQVIYSAGDPATALFVVGRGKVELSRPMDGVETADGKVLEVPGARTPRAR